MREASPFESIRHTHTGLLYICMKRGIIVESWLRKLIRSPVLSLSLSLLLSAPLFFPSYSRAQEEVAKIRDIGSTPTSGPARSPRIRDGIIGGRWIGIWLETSSGAKVCTILLRSIDGRKKSSVPNRLRLFILFSTKIRRWNMEFYS